MTVGDGHSGLGATRHHWVPPVRANVQAVLRTFSGVTANTYICHPWCGWGRWSVDFWGPGGRGDPISDELSRASLNLLWRLPGPPFIRHYIYRHDLWTSWGGHSLWRADDHSGNLQHLHVTYWRG